MGIASSKASELATSSKTFKCIPCQGSTYCCLKNETYHDENQEILFNTDEYTTSDHDVIIFGTNVFNNISVFPNAIFEKFPYLRIVMFNDAQLKTLTKKSFSNCLGLEDLRLERNLIEHLDAGVFEECENILGINLETNKISSIDKDAFRNLWVLQSLRLSDNSISTLHQDTFNHIPSLLQLIMNKNLITNLHNDTFKQVKSLFDLDLSYNKIVTIETALFNGTGLILVRLGHNRINAIQPNFFEFWPSNGIRDASLALDYNFCIKKNFTNIGSEAVPVKSIIPQFAQCFKNYMRPRLNPNV